MSGQYSTISTDPDSEYCVHVENQTENVFFFGLQMQKKNEEKRTNWNDFILR